MDSDFRINDPLKVLPCQVKNFVQSWQLCYWSDVRRIMFEAGSEKDSLNMNWVAVRWQNFNTNTNTAKIMPPGILLASLGFHHEEAMNLV